MHNQSSIHHQIKPPTESNPSNFTQHKDITIQSSTLLHHAILTTLAHPFSNSPQSNSILNPPNQSHPRANLAPQPRTPTCSPLLPSHVVPSTVFLLWKERRGRDESSSETITGTVLGGIRMPASSRVSHRLAPIELAEPRRTRIGRKIGRRSDRERGEGRWIRDIAEYTFSLSAFLFPQRLVEKRRTACCFQEFISPY